MRRLPSHLNGVKTSAYTTPVTSTARAGTAASPYHHGDLFEALAVEALDQVRVRGAESVSLRGVAQAVGVSASAAYHHFPDKTALLHEVAQRGKGELSAVARADGTSPAALVERLRATGAGYIGFAVAEPHLFRHTFGPYCGAAGGKDADASSSAAYTTMVDSLDAMQDAGMLRSRDGLELLAWTAVHGFACLVIDDFLPVEAAEALLGTLLAGFMTEPPPTR
jgi:AcrR family transcriptional regulator